jgi:membrane-associated protease RseP (regulator of RpoE activity)
MNPEMDAAVTTCGNCRLPMPKELRFCRNCGFRLGEGSAEYTETVRFQNVPPGAFAGNSSPNSFPHGMGGPMTVPPGQIGKRRRRRMSGMTWMFLGLLIFFIAGGVFTSIINSIRDNVPAKIMQQAAPHSYAGVDDFETTDGGITFANVEPPDGPADKAGLVGGDIITTVDGQPVHSDDEMAEILRRIPIGKTVDVIYIRDGETKNTKLTTISREEMKRLEDVFGNRPQGRGQFGYEDGDAERVEIPNTKMFGVQLGEILPNRPADLAGVKQGDIVVEFDGVPIRTSEEFLSRVRRALPYSTIQVVVMRNGERVEIPVKMGKQ